jgi:hypothetical protein
MNTTATTVISTTTLDCYYFDPEHGAPAGGRSNLREELFGDLVGCNDIASLLMRYRATFLMVRARGNDPMNMLSLNFKFVDSPGQFEGFYSL